MIKHVGLPLDVLYDREWWRVTSHVESVTTACFIASLTLIFNLRVSHAKEIKRGKRNEIK